jgi:LacI family transcriptional regulator
VVALGHVRIGHVGGPQNLSTGHRRYLGFIEAMGDASLDAAPERIRFGAFFTEEEGAKACDELLEAAPDVTAIVAGNDLMAIGCYDTLEKRGLRCPDDISIVGFNDMPFVDRLRPPLTSVRIPQREIGQVAADMLLEQLRGGEEPATGDDAGAAEILLEPALIVRGSTRAPSR